MSNRYVTAFSVPTPEALPNMYWGPLTEHMTGSTKQKPSETTESQTQKSKHRETRAGKGVHLATQLVWRKIPPSNVDWNSRACSSTFWLIRFLRGATDVFNFIHWDRFAHCEHARSHQLPEPHEHGGYVRVSGRAWLPFQGLCLSTLAGFLSPQPQDSALWLFSGVVAQSPILYHSPVLSVPWKAFLGSWDFVQSLGAIITKQSLTFGKNMNFGPCRRC